MRTKIWLFHPLFSLTLFLICFIQLLNQLDWWNQFDWLTFDLNNWWRMSIINLWTKSIMSVSVKITKVSESNFHLFQHQRRILGRKCQKVHHGDMRSFTSLPRLPRYSEGLDSTHFLTDLLFQTALELTRFCWNIKLGPSVWMKLFGYLSLSLYVALVNDKRIRAYHNIHRILYCTDLFLWSFI